MSRQDELRAEIERLSAKEDLVRNWRSMVTPLSSFSDKDKIAAFDALYVAALREVEDIAGGDVDGDGSHYIYEGVMTRMLGKDVFKNVINKLL